MASPTVTLEPTAVPGEPVPNTQGTLLVCLPSLPSGSLHEMRAHLDTAMPGRTVLLAAPEAEIDLAHEGTQELLPLPVPSRAHPVWVLAASDFEAAAELAEQQGAVATLVLGPEALSIRPQDLRLLADAVTLGQIDLVLPRYHTGTHEGLVSAALLSPLTRALFGVAVHLPLPLDAAFSTRAAARLRAAARRQTAAASEALLWPAAEAAVANLKVAEVQSGERVLPHPGTSDLNALLAEVLASLFADLETKAAFWQRARVTSVTHAPLSDDAAPDADMSEIAGLVESFRNAYANLYQIWALVLPPHSLLALKKLSLTPAESFRMPAALWARTVYEFVMAYRLRTLNRGHLLGAFTPLYLAWVASYLRYCGNDDRRAEAYTDETAIAFETEKPYLVSRWRWPDRFNP